MFDYCYCFKKSLQEKKEAGRKKSQDGNKSNNTVG
jgi:hypothetical protein